MDHDRIDAWVGDSDHLAVLQTELSSLRSEMQHSDSGSPWVPIWMSYLDLIINNVGVPGHDERPAIGAAYRRADMLLDALCTDENILQLAAPFTLSDDLPNDGSNIYQIIWMVRAAEAIWSLSPNGEQALPLRQLADELMRINSGLAHWTAPPEDIKKIELVTSHRRGLVFFLQMWKGLEQEGAFRNLGQDMCRQLLLGMVLSAYAADNFGRAKKIRRRLLSGWQSDPDTTQPGSPIARPEWVAMMELWDSDGVPPEWAIHSFAKVKPDTLDSILAGYLGLPE